MGIKKYELKPNPRDVNGFKKNDKVYVSIQIGNGQMGSSKISRDGVLLAKGELTQHTFIGEADSLMGKDINILTNILDVNSFTNMCVITTTMLNQNSDVLFSKIDKGEASEGGFASFIGKYRIVPTIIFIFLLVFSSFSSIYAQDNFDKTNYNTATFQSLETPTSPGFILFDKGPSSIEKPTTPKGFGISILGLLQGTGGATEVAPFWLINHPNLSVEEMYKNKFPILYNFSISTATIKTDTASYIASGFRTQLFKLYNKKTINDLDLIKANIVSELADIDPDNPDTSNIVRLKEKYLELIEMPIFTVDFACAIGGSSMSNSYKDLLLNRWSAWVNLNWRPKGDDFYITALARYINNNHFENYADEITLIDSGIRLNYDLNSFCLSLEYLQRFNLTNDGSENRIAAIGSYQLSDNIYITTTLGKNFSNVNNIIAIAGINIGFSNSKAKAF